MSVLFSLAEKVNDALRLRGLTLATAESCTGGTIASAITSVAGSSDVFKGGVVAYSNSVKMSILNVSPATLERYGAVSKETVEEMVAGVKKALDSSCAIATSGIAGPSGGTAEKPVGTVWVAIAVGETVTTELLQLGDNARRENIAAATEQVLNLLFNRLNKCSLSE